MVLGVKQNCARQPSLRASARFWHSQNRQQRERTADAVRRKANKLTAKIRCGATKFVKQAALGNIL